MAVYLDVVLARNFLLDMLLLGAAGRLCGPGVRPVRLAAGAAFGAVWAAAGYLPGLEALSSFPGAAAAGAAMALLTYGRGCRRQLLALWTLGLCLGGFSWLLAQFGLLNTWSLFLEAGLIYLAARLLGAGAKGGLTRARVALGSREAEFTLLRDTGNSLRDPLSGGEVLLLEAACARRLGLPISDREAADPTALVQALSARGLKCRLIPYRALGSGGMLAAVRCRATVDGRTVELVAFAPGKLSRDGSFEGLTGGKQG